MNLELTEKQKKKILGSLYDSEKSNLFDEFYDILQTKLIKKQKYAKHLRYNLTKHEEKLWVHLSSKAFKNAGIRFRRQVAKFGYILDFYCPNSLLCVELDGLYHERMDQQVSDMIREMNLSKIGIQVIRIKNEDLQLESKLELIKELGALRLAAYRKQGIDKPDILVNYRGLKLSFLNYCDSGIVNTDWSSKLLF